jgi:GT2 family glycosyltransferase
MEMTRVPRVLISLVNWNGGAAIARCLGQLRMQTFPHTRVIVVDNGSTDGSIEAIRQADPSLIVLENFENRGYAGGHNVAIRYGLREGFDYFWLLNYDTTLEPGTLAALIDSAENDHTVGAISPVIYKAEQPEQIQFCGTWMDIHKYSFCNARDFSELDAHQSSNASHLLLWGTALLLSREAIQAAGLLDERYFAYYEDLDLTDRIHRAGFRNRVSPGARIWHSGVNSICSRPPYYVYYNVRNHYLYWSERLTMTDWLRHWRLLTTRTLGFIGELKKGSGPDWIDATLCGFKDALLGRCGAWDQRRRAPTWLYVLATAHPYALQHLLEGRFIALFSGIVANLRGRIRPRQ